jgi:aryl carrier-like protein
VELRELPLTGSGKVDRKRLRQSERVGKQPPEGARGEDEPRTEVEATLAKIWSDTLGLEHIGIHDNFFELGGDSILSIQITTKANRAGLHLSPKHLFDSPTIAQLALVATRDSDTLPHVEQGAVSGHLPLTPIQHWFFERTQTNPHHFNQAVMLELRQPYEGALVKQAVAALIRHHDALRLRFRRDEQGQWSQFNLPAEAAEVAFDAPDSTDGQEFFSYLDLSATSVAEQRTAIESYAAHLQTTLDITQGPLLRASVIDLGAEQAGRLVFVVHHLAVDGVSWRVLLEDLQTAYEQLAREEAVALPAKTTSFKEWAQRLEAYAQTDEVTEELSYWTAQKGEVAPLPVDYAGGENTVASARTVAARLSVAETQALLQDVPRAYTTQINDVLVTALAATLSEWSESAAVRIDMEGHGREELFEGVDTTRTVGWFTSVYGV